MSRLDWSHADSPIARIRYASMSPAEERRWLGEYCTRDGHAREIVDTIVTAPLNQRVIDLARGSDAAIFAAVRPYLAAAGSEAAQVAPELRAEREASGKGFSVTIARRELRRWLSESDEGRRVEGLVGRLLG